MPPGRVLVLARNAALPRSAAEALRALGHEVAREPDSDQARRLLFEEGWDVVIGDRNAAEELLGDARELPEPPEVILLDGFGSISDAVHDIERGAFDCIAMPAPDEQVVLAVARAIESRRLATENKSLREGLGRRFALDNLISRDARMLEVFDIVRSVADTKANILIEGESGTGKTMLARTVHIHSSRRRASFVHVNCGAIPASLLESELFGHVKGAFTGAVRDRVGKFEAADGGTIFLDEIATASEELQVKLLRVLESGRFERVGDTRTLSVDARLISASNRVLEEEVAAGRFREDLYYRINVVRIEIPPLRARPADILLLAEHFLGRYAEEHDRPLATLTAEARERLVRHPWSGNVRQLQHTIERAVLLASGEAIEAHDLGPEFVRERADGSPRGRAGAEPEEPPLGPLKQALEGPERRIILRGLQHTGGNRKATAELLGINRTTLFNKMRKYELLSFPSRLSSGSGAAEETGAEREGGAFGRSVAEGPSDAA